MGVQGVREGHFVAKKWQWWIGLSWTALFANI